MGKQKFALIFYKAKDNPEIYFDSTAYVDYNNETNSFVVTSKEYVGCNEKAFGIISGNPDFIYGNHANLKMDKYEDEEVFIYIFDDDYLKSLEKHNNKENFDVHAFIADKASTLKIEMKEDKSLVAKRISNKNAVLALASTSIVLSQLDLDDFYQDEPIQKKEEIAPEDEEEIEILTISIPDMIESISKKIVGQEDVISTLVSNICYNQILIDELENKEDYDPSELDSRKVSILLDGSTGTGKTAIAKEISKLLGLPMEIVNANSFSQTGYVGASITDVLKKLLEKTDYNFDLAERGIVFFDEVDKLAQNNNFTGKDMNKGVQEELLGFLSGSKYDINDNPLMYVSSSSGQTEFDTSKLTFILSGSFTDLRDKKVKEARKNNIGFGKDNSKVTNYSVSAQDYIDYGLMREFFGRIKVLTFTKEYTREDLKTILLTSEISPLKNLEKTVQLFGYSGIVYEEEFLNAVVDEAYEMKTGARALQSIMSGVQDSILLDLENNKFDLDMPINLSCDLLSKYKKKYVRKLQ